MYLSGGSRGYDDIRYFRRIITAGTAGPQPGGVLGEARSSQEQPKAARSQGKSMRRGLVWSGRIQDQVLFGLFVFIVFFFGGGELKTIMLLAKPMVLLRVPETLSR